VLDRQIIEAVGISERQIEQTTQAVKNELERRERLFRGSRPPLNVEGCTVLLVDDGIATGSSMRAAINALRQMKPARIVVAVPVAPVSTCNRLRPEVDELVCLHMPESFFAVGQFYADFSQVPDEDVAGILQHGAEPAVQKARQKRATKKGASP
jgi:putative phosphoribosyl transferase